MLDQIYDTLIFTDFLLIIIMLSVTIIMVMLDIKMSNMTKISGKKTIVKIDYNYLNVLDEKYFFNEKGLDIYKIPSKIKYINEVFYFNENYENTYNNVEIEYKSNRNRYILVNKLELYNKYK